jgi:hypothetical protein
LNVPAAKHPGDVRYGRPFCSSSVGLTLTAGPRCLLLGYVPMILLASSIGVWLFYIQHQFEDTYWAVQADWDFGAAALQGSSFYDLPPILHWLTATSVSTTSIISVARCRTIICALASSRTRRSGTPSASPCSIA